VEDNEINAMVASHFLTNIGANFKVATDGQEAVDTARSEPFDVILMDVQLPTMDGMEATRMIRASEDPKVRDVVIVALTASALASERTGCFEAGMNDYLSKPFSQADLSAMLTKWRLDK
jgi:CheY-like chemotaxis protein